MICLKPKKKGYVEKEKHFQELRSEGRGEEEKRDVNNDRNEKMQSRGEVRKGK